MAASGILGHGGFSWRGSLLPLGCAAAPFVSAAHSSGSKLPHHKSLAISCSQSLEVWSGCR
ncbi:hypothetical protein EPZ47_15910 [Pseudomonas viciae]|uniref:Uncharacterized protein n=1 Tax=Pseudomonas viciae TaxID=2505979 RepID=A0A4V1CBL5_9PSED|nr:hypothetical protein EPZ47_15910 [Pseudomonas viciae]